MPTPSPYQPSLPLPAPSGEMLLDGESSVVLYRDVLSTSEAQESFRVLRRDLWWQQHQIRSPRGPVPQPRLVAWTAPNACTYRYSGVELDPDPWHPKLLALKAICEHITKASFNACLANLYRDGQDSVGWHSDNEPELGDSPTVASISLGAERRFHLRRIDGSHRPIRITLPSGSLLVMAGRCQQLWQHQIPKAAGVTERINLTFRPHNRDCRAGR
jgi:alkylated DNA repair dioxygenase AlkB